MEAPLGNTIGNSLEIVESIHCMQGKAPRDLEELICAQGILIFLFHLFPFSLLFSVFV
jgi:thymidine phosphorylase